MKDFDLVKRYLDKSMSEAERQAFEGRLEGEEGPALKRELELQRIERAAIRLHREDRRRAIIQEASEEAAGEQAGGRARKFNFRALLLAAAASAAVLLVGGYFLMRSQYTGAVLALDNYKFSMDERQVRGSEEQADRLRQGKAFFGQGEYDKAIAAFSEIEGLPVISRYLIAHCYFQKEDYESAASRFQEIMQLGAGAGDYESEARWYFVLSKLAMGAEDAAFRAALEEVRRTEGETGRMKKLDGQLNSIFR